MKTKNVEGVPYYRFKVEFRTTDGKRHRETHWSPGEPFVYGEVGRSIANRFPIETVVPGSCTVRIMP